MLEGKEESPLPVIPAPRVSPPPTLPNTLSIDNGVQSAHTPPVRVQAPTTTIALRMNYHPLPTKRKPPVPTSDTKKRKHGSKSSTLCYFEDTSSESDANSNHSGDGYSSGDSIPPDAKPAKRQCTSTVITRSSTRTPAIDSGIQDTLNSLSLTPTNVQPSSTIPDVDVTMSVDCPDSLSTDTATTNMSISPTDLQPPDVNVTMSVDHTDTLSTDTATTNMSISPTDLQPPNISADTVDGDDSGVVSAAEVKTTPTAETGVTPATEAEVVIGPGSVAGVPSITTTVTPPLASSNIVDVGGVPSFLRSHSKGNRRVDIFNYLNEVQDPRFCKVVYHYINFEISDNSCTNGSLPTANRPIEISQWSSRACPAAPPDHKKGKRTFVMFVDSVFAWWHSLQPLWRTFQRGMVSRTVKGDWGVLRAPRINGLLNVIILVYWWARVLEEQEPGGGARADYEFFADDVAWVLLHLST